MAGLLLRLRLRLLANTLSRGTQAAIGLMLGTLFGTLGALLVGAGLASTHAEPSWPEAVTAVYGALWVGWLVFPAVTFASDDTLDPRRFALFGLRPAELVPGLLAGALASVGPVATLVAAAGAMVGAGQRSGSPVATLLAGAAAVLLVVVSVACSRALLALVSDLLSSRRGRDLVGALGAVLVMGIAFGGQVGGIAGTLADDSDVLAPLAGVAAWTPGGQAGAAIGDAVAGEVGRTAARLAAVAAVTGVALVVWAWAIRRTQVTSPTHGTRRSARTGLYPRLLAWLPRTRSTAVAVRFLRSLARDGRVRTQALSHVFIVLPAVALSVGSLGSGNAPLAAAYTVVPIALLGSNQLGFDGPALWQHELAGDDPRADLRGRSLALAVLAVPLGVVAAIALAVAFDAWALLPAALLLIVATLLVLLGVANAASVLAPYPIPEDASNVFGSGASGAGCLQGVLVAVVMVTHGVTMLPIVVPMVMVPSPSGRVVVGLLGIAYGAVVMVGGTRLGAARAEGRGPEILQAIDPRRS